MMSLFKSTIKEIFPGSQYAPKNVKPVDIILGVVESNGEMEGAISNDDISHKTYKFKPQKITVGANFIAYGLNEFSGEVKKEGANEIKKPYLLIIFNEEMNRFFFITPEKSISLKPCDFEQCINQSKGPKEKDFRFSSIKNLSEEMKTKDSFFAKYIKNAMTLDGGKLLSSLFRKQPYAYDTFPLMVEINFRIALLNTNEEYVIKEYSPPFFSVTRVKLISNLSNIEKENEDLNIDVQFEKETEANIRHNVFLKQKRDGGFLSVPSWTIRWVGRKSESNDHPKGSIADIANLDKGNKAIFEAGIHPFSNLFSMLNELHIVGTKLAALPRIKFFDAPTRIIDDTKNQSLEIDMRTGEVDIPWSKIHSSVKNLLESFPPDTLGIHEMNIALDENRKEIDISTFENNESFKKIEISSKPVKSFFSCGSNDNNSKHTHKSPL